MSTWCENWELANHAGPFYNVIHDAIAVSDVPLAGLQLHRQLWAEGPLLRQPPRLLLLHRQQVVAYAAIAMCIDKCFIYLPQGICVCMRDCIYSAKAGLQIAESKLLSVLFFNLDLNNWILNFDIEVRIESLKLLRFGDWLKG